jgi:autotransporter-associated beta strand protein
LTVNGVGGTGDAGHISPHAVGSTGTLNVGSLTLNGGSILDLNVGAPGTNDLIASTGVLTLPGAGTGNVTVNLTNLGGFTTGTYKIISESGTTNFSPTSFSIGVGISGFQEGFSNPGAGVPGGGTEIDLVVTPAPTWKAVAQDTNWANANNWVAGLIPGSTSSTSNTDLAAFTTSTNITNPAPDANRNLQNILFDLPGASAYVIGTTGGNALLLTTGGQIKTTSLITQTETINAPLVLEGASGSYTFSSNAPAAANVLVIGGGVTGGAAGNTVLTLSGTNTGANAVNGVIGNGAATTMAVMKTGGGTWVLGGNNTYTGGVDIEAGTLRVGNAGALNAASPNAVTFGPASNGTLAINGNNVTITGLNSTSTTAQVINGNATSATLTVNTLAASSFAGVIADGPGGGNLNLIVTDAGLTLSGNNTFSGTTDVTGAATLTLASANALQNSTLHATVNNNVFFSPGVGTFTIGGLSGNGNIVLQDTAATPAPITASVGNNGGSTIYSGVLSGPGGLTKIGAGTLTLTNANTYTGTTRVSAGTLKLGDGAASNGSVASGVIINNATLAFANPLAQSYVGSIVGTGAVTKTSGAGALTLTGNSTYSGGTTIGGGSTVNVGPAPFPATPLGTGTVSLTGATLALRGALNSGVTGNFYNNTPTNNNNVDTDYQNAGVESYAAMTAHFGSLLPDTSVLTSFNGKTNLDYSNNNYGGPNAMFNQTGPTNALYGFTGSQNIETQLTGFINIKTAGNYTFATTSDDGSDLFIDGPTNDGAVVANNAFQGATTRTGTVTLTAGLHQIDVGYYQGGGGQGLLVQYSGPDTGGTTVTMSNAVLQPTTGPLSLAAFQTYSNGVTVTGNSTIDVSGSLAATFTGGLTIGANTLNLTSSDATINPYSLTFTSVGTLTGNATFNVANSAGGGPGTLNLGGLNEGAGGPFGVTKTGPGTLVMAGQGNYAGGTTISAAGGTVQANGPGTLGTGAVTLNNGTTLRLGANPNPVPTITGFNGGVGWTVNNQGAGTNDPPFGLGPNTLSLTSAQNDVGRSVIKNNRVNFANGFVATFTYAITNGGGNPADGAAFFLENDPRGATAIGGNGGFLAYAGAITPSAGYLINSYNGHPIGTQFDVNGTDPGNNYLSVAPVNYLGNLTTGDPVNVKLVYDPVSQTITESLFDTVTSATFSRTTSTGGDLAALLGDTQAYVGISGATGGLNMTQTITNFTYSDNTATNYTNAVNLTGGASATLDMSTIGPTQINMGPLTVGAGVNTTLNLTAASAPANVSYGYGFASATINGNLAINMATNGTGKGSMSINGPSTFPNNNTAVTVNSGTLRFANTGSASAIATGTTINVTSGASLELAGTTSNLSDPGSPSHRAHISNQSSLPFTPAAGGGLIVSGTNQQVGVVDGPGDTGVNAGASLTVDHIIQTTLAIGGSDATHTGLVTINSSSATGAPTGGGLALAGSLDPGTPFGSGSGSSSGLAANASAGDSLGGSAAGGAGGASASVPEPSSLLLVVLGGLACLAPVIHRRKRA